MLLLSIATKDLESKISIFPICSPDMPISLLNAPKISPALTLFFFPPSIQMVEYVDQILYLKLLSTLIL